MYPSRSDEDPNQKTRVHGAASGENIPPNSSILRSPPVRSPQVYRNRPTAMHSSVSSGGLESNLSQDYNHLSRPDFTQNPSSFSSVNDYRRKNSLPAVQSRSEASKYRRPSDQNPSSEPFKSSYGSRFDERKRSEALKYNSMPHSVAIRQELIVRSDPLPELDPDFLECIHDFLATVDVQGEELQSLRQFLDVFLSRLYRRLDRKYSVVDCFAAAAVGARRFMIHIGHGTSENSQMLELIIAKSLAGLLVDSRTLEDVINRAGIDEAAGFLDGLKARSGNERQYVVDQIAAEYIRRADSWTPQTAAKASQLRKKRGKKDRFLSVFLDIEEVKAAMNLNAIDQAKMGNQFNSFKISQPSYTRTNEQSYNPYLAAIQPNYYSENRYQDHSDHLSAFPNRSIHIQPLQTEPNDSPLIRQRKSSFSVEQARQRSFSSEQRKQSLGETTQRPDDFLSTPPAGSPISARTSRRGSAEALLQSVLDECENLIGTLKLPSGDKSTNK